MELLLDEADAWERAFGNGENNPAPPDFTIPEIFYNGKTIISTPTLVNSGCDSLASPYMELRESGITKNGGKGWFAKETIAAGTILMIAKPIALLMDYEEDAANDADVELYVNADNAQFKGPEVMVQDQRPMGTSPSSKKSQTPFQNMTSDPIDIEDGNGDDDVDEDENVLMEDEDAFGTAVEADMEEGEDDDVEIDDEDEDWEDETDNDSATDHDATKDPKELSSHNEVTSIASSIGEHEEDGDEEIDDGDEEPDARSNELLLLQILRKILDHPSLWSQQLTHLFPRTENDIATLPTKVKSYVCHDDAIFLQVEHLMEQLEMKQALLPMSATVENPNCFTKSEIQQISKRLPLIIRYNVLSVETCCELLSYPGPGGHINLSGVGLYHLPSYFNHSPNQKPPNVSRYSIGDVMFFVTNQHVPIGTELTISYIEHDILCENAFRRNSMLQMDFEDTDAVPSTADLHGPAVPVVDPEVQNELMGMNPHERLDAINELLKQAGADSVANADVVDSNRTSLLHSIREETLEHFNNPDDMYSTEKSAEHMDSSQDDTRIVDVDHRIQEDGYGLEQTIWFQCDINNLRILKALTLDGISQTKMALYFWEESIKFVESKHMPPNDENSVVLHTQAALCSLQLHYNLNKCFNTVDNEIPPLQLLGASMDQQSYYRQRALEHAALALKVHMTLFGGDVHLFRRRLYRDITLPLRPITMTTTHHHHLVPPIDVLWPLHS